MLVFSIDPGVSGAICVFKNKDILEIYDVPTMVDGKKNKRQINSAQVTHIFKSFLHESDKVSVIVEQVNAMPGQGVTSMFNFGQSNQTSTNRDNEFCQTTKHLLKRLSITMTESSN